VQGQRRVHLAGASAVATLAVVVALVAGGADNARAGSGTLALERVGDFDQPVRVTHAPGSRKLLFVVEQRGTIEVLRKRKPLGKPFLDLTERVRYGGEEGLLGLAFDPEYARNRRFYVYYVDTAGDIRVDMLRRKRSSKTRANARTRSKVIVVPHPTHSNHNGGTLEFGRDGFLYIGTGDGGSANDPPGNAQNPEVLLGKLLRIDPGRRRGYRSPASNPFSGGPGRDEIFALGLRNPYRWSFDRPTGSLWIGDVGQGAWEEINRVSVDAAGGANFGWDLFEGNHEFEGDAQNPPPDYVPPVFEYANGGDTCAVTGGYVSRDRTVPALLGRYVYADYCDGSLRSFDPADPAGTDAALGLSPEAVSGFGLDARNRLYVASLGGPVQRIVQR
jgi:glucose/arabinose dehydrogenase